MSQDCPQSQTAPNTRGEARPTATHRRPRDIHLGSDFSTQREGPTLRDDAERLEAEAAALEASCATLEAENASIEAVMKLRLGDAQIGAPVKAPARPRAHVPPKWYCRDCA